jgi:hypothetical protein
MTSIKLPRIPDRTPIKITIAILPEIHQMLSDYADLYRTTYGANDSIADLVPHMLAAFLASDRAFARRKIAPDGAADGGSET